jgi:hypothetical protein
LGSLLFFNNLRIFISHLIHNNLKEISFLSKVQERNEQTETSFSIISPLKLIASPLRTEPSPIELIEALGTDSEKFVTETLLRSYVFENLPPNEANSIWKEEGDYQSRLNRVKDFLKSVKVIGISQEKTWLPTWEIHRPKIDGCTATLKSSSSSQTDFSLNIKIFGVGGGATKSKDVGYTDTIEAAGECLQVRLPITTTILECISKGEKFIRASVKEIGTFPSAIELKGSSDHCGLNPSQLSLWETHDIVVPPKTTQEHSLSVKSAQGAGLDLGLTIAGVTIGLKVVLKLQKQIDYSYKLVGSNRYLAYFPKNAITYYWSVNTRKRGDEHF